MVFIKKNNQMTIFPNHDDLFQFAAMDFKNRAIEAIKDKGIFSVVLSGGETPKLFFNALTRLENHKKDIPWEKIQFFFGDERYVPSDNINSNYHTAQQYLFSKVPVNPNHIYAIPTTFHDPKDAAKNYEQILRKIFHIQDNSYPPFDLVYLGLGDNAHTASLMPLSDVVKNEIQHPLNDKNNPLVVSLFAPELDMYRITLTPKAINHAKEIIFLVVGEDKAAAVWHVLEAQPDPLLYPAQLIHCVNKKNIWYLDQDAAGKLNIS